MTKCLANVGPTLVKHWSMSSIEQIHLFYRLEVVISLCDPQLKVHENYRTYLKLRSKYTSVANCFSFNCLFGGQIKSVKTTTYPLTTGPDYILFWGFVLAH